MAGLFGGMKSAFSGWNKADANGLTGMQRLGNFGSAMQGQAPMFIGQPQQPQSQSPEQAPQPDFAQRLGQFGAQMQRLGNFGSAMQGQAPMYAPSPQQPQGQGLEQAPPPDFGQRLGQFGAQMQGMGSPSVPPPQQMGQFGAQMQGMGPQPNIRDILQRIYGGR